MGKTIIFLVQFFFNYSQNLGRSDDNNIENKRDGPMISIPVSIDVSGVMLEGCRREHSKSPLETCAPDIAQYWLIHWLFYFLPENTVKIANFQNWCSYHILQKCEKLQLLLVEGARKVPFLL